MENALMIIIDDKPYHQDGPVRNADTKSPCCLPQRAASPPCSRALLWASNYLTHFMLGSIGEAIFRARSRLLPALREGGRAAGASSAAYGNGGTGSIWVEISDGKISSSQRRDACAN